MRWLAKLRMRVTMLFARGRAAAALDEELRFHIEQQIAEYRAAGMSDQDARYSALRLFGNPALLRDQARATWSWSSVEILLRDLRLGVRGLVRAPGFALIAILVMALGIGANVALFTVVRSVILKPLPFKDPGSLVMLYEHGSPENDPAAAYYVVAGGIYAEWKKLNHSFSSMALIQESDVGLAGSGGQLSEKLTALHCTWDLMTTLGVQPALGRDFNAADDSRSANGTVLLSWSLWKRRFAADPAIVNRTIYIDAKPYTVIGVMPAWFAFPDARTELWTPVYHDEPAAFMAMLDTHAFLAVGRLKPGVNAEQATADLSVISRRLHDAHADNPFINKRATSRPLLEHMVGDIEKPLYVLLAATGCVLLIACLNVANLLVARAAGRRREMAIRTALGGGWLRLLRERLTESFLLAAAGGAAGLLLAYGAVAWLVSVRKDMSRVEGIHIDAVVIAFTVGVIALCALFSGLISAFSAKDKQVFLTLHESSRSAGSGPSKATLRKVLLILEVGLTVVLLTGAGLLLKSYDRLRSTDVGCITSNVLTMQLGLPGARYKTPGPGPVNFFDELLRRVRALPGVEAAGLVDVVPGGGYEGDSSFTILEHPALPKGEGLDAMNRAADARYFAAMGIPILRGRTFNENLRLDKANEMLITDSFVKQYFPGEEPLGKHLRTNGRDYVIVGVAADTRFEIGEPPRPMKYFPMANGEMNYATLVLRSSQDVEQIALPVQRVMQSMDRDIGVSDVLTMNQLLGKSMLDESFNTTMLAGFAGLSLLLAAVGLFGVLSYIAAQRTGEIGIRIALGAQRQQVLRLMLLDGLRPALFGLALGLAASVATARLIRTMLYGTKPLDPLVFASVSALLLLVAAVACLVPAWRASRLDPMQALRME